jgi:large subunit ribosomal protein L21
MYAIIETGGKQYRVIPGETYKVEKLEGEKGTPLTFKALWTSLKEEGGGVGGGTVTAEIVRQFRAPKILVFKKRRKKGYKKMQGHRQNLTEIQVKEIK